MMSLRDKQITDGQVGTHGRENERGDENVVTLPLINFSACI